MTPSIWINFGTETSSSSYADWVGVPGSPGSSNQALMSLDDVPDFDKDVDDALEFNFDHPIGAQLDGANDWHRILFNSALPFPLALTDDASSTMDTVHQPLSPVSDGTLVNSPSLSPIPDLKLPPQGDQHVDHMLPSSSESSPFDGFQFDFTFEIHGQVTVMPLPASSYGLSAGYDAPVYDYDGFWPGYPLVQHTVGAAGAGVTGLATGMGLNVDSAASSFMAPSLPPCSSPPSSPVDEKDEMIIVDEKAAEVNEEKDAPVVKKAARATRMKRRTDSDDGYSSGDSHNSDESAPKRKRRKQDTTKRFLCPFEGCGQAFSRTHNLKQHTASVHEGKRPYGCRELGCERSFSRKHDLTRHHQSEHTDLGSPRNAGNAKKGNTKKGNANKKSKTIAKDEHD
ncbi:hypothetical protein DICSQDRAFT_164134 [Dichomitus squalens LYAD-421 SS1]|uniref:C2H2-type domain-containing protein n=1 Tax=Dichomitus squalens (strain LYAD-421) TaxID=732165 RepID=R7SI26_DICSQ|nr:uncharacterized protein DICSQDRAFT_164134 [Dichomitus squalens LYAD-421 SS1]EJF55799.1 hypothetical protein DICSQDRAFT_164134 [Dichomitus squalens LYAD-421 SS1]